MKLAISNIAWQPAQRDAAFELMAQNGFAGLEIAPGLAFEGEDDPWAPSPRAVADFEQAMARFGLRFVSMQSLLFGVCGAQLFGDAQEQQAFIGAMERAIGLAGRLGIPNLVFGSPRNRIIPEGMPRQSAMSGAIDFFRRLGEAACMFGARIAIEPNPVAYGTNFLNTMDETAEFVAQVGHPGISLNFDVGAVIMCGQIDRLEALFDAYSGLVSHVHLSEPNLTPSPSSVSVARQVKRMCADAGYDGWISIEMRAPDDRPVEIVSACMTRLVEA